MARDGKILHIDESGDYPFAIDKKTVLEFGLQVLGTPAQDLILLIKLVEKTGNPAEATYTFTWEGKTHARKIKIHPATAPWTQQGATAQIHQHHLEVCIN